MHQQQHLSLQRLSHQPVEQPMEPNCHVLRCLNLLTFSICLPEAVRHCDLCGEWASTCGSIHSPDTPLSIRCHTKPLALRGVGSWGKLGGSRRTICGNHQECAEICGCAEELVLTCVGCFFMKCSSGYDAATHLEQHSSYPSPRRAHASQFSAVPCAFLLYT